MKIIRIVRTCVACPSQWDGWDEKGNSFYIKYRNGILRVDVNCKETFRKPLSDGLHGFMEYEDLKKHLSGFVSLPEQEENPDFVKETIEENKDYFDSLCGTIEDLAYSEKDRLNHSTIVNPYDELPPLGFRVTSSWEEYRDQLPILVIGVNPFKHCIRNHKFPPEFEFIDHQTGGIACHHPGLLGRALPVAHTTRIAMEALHSRWYGSNCGALFGANLKEIIKYESDIYELLGVSCNNSFNDLEEGYYPIDIEEAQKLTTEKLPEDLDDWIEWTGPENSIFKNLGAIGRWSLRIYGENSD